MASTRRQHPVSNAETGDARAASFHVRTLGELRVDGPEGVVRALRRKERLLLAYLARAASPVPRPQLAALLWGRGSESRARQSLRQALFALRQALGEAIDVGADLVRLRPGAVTLDLAQLEAALAAGEAAMALARWPGEFLPGLEDAGDEPLRDWIEAERATLWRLRAAAQARTAGAGLGEALAAWRSVRAGGTAVLRIAGKAAAGVCDALAGDVAAGEPALVLRLRPGDGAPRRAWGAAAALLAPLRAARGLSGVADATLAEVAVLVPSIRVRFPRLPAARGGDDALAHAATETIGDVAAETPLLVCVEDAARCDPETRRWLERLAAELPPGVLLVIGEAATPHAEAQADAAASSPVTAAPVSAPVTAMPPPVTALPASSALSVAQASGSWSRARAWLRGRRAARVSMALALAAAAMAVLLTLPLLRGWTPLRQPTVLAVGSVHALGLGAADPAAMALPELLTTQLARVDGVEVVSRGRMLELSAQAPGELAAARLAGATELLEGELYRRGARYHLELRRLDARSGRVRGVYTAEEEHALDLTHAIAGAVARGLGLAAPVLTYAPSSVAARALYEAGLQAFYQRRDYASALRLFSGALEADPDFAMAALFAARASGIVDGHMSASAFLQRADAAADHAPERDRLFIRASVALFFSDPDGLRYAEQLAARYASDPTGPLLLGLFLSAAGRFTESAAQLRRALAMQPPAADAPATFCSPCEAYAALNQAYFAADSMEAAMRAAAEWAARQPRNPDPLTALAALQMLGGHDAEAAETQRRAALLGSDQGDDVLWSARHGIHRGDFAAVDAGLEYLAGVSGSETARAAAWLQFISLRDQRRLDEAWRAATRYRELSQPAGPATHPHATLQAILLMERGAGRQAAALFDTMYHQLGDLGRDSRTARDRAWLLTLRATALAAAGDTAGLPALADQVQRLGAFSAYARDSRLHHHVRGLLLRARGDLTGAEREFRAAIYSTTAGFTRTNVELARVLLELGRTAEAIALLDATLRAPLDGPALYVTRTEVRELLARARG